MKTMKRWACLEHALAEGTHKRLERLPLGERTDELLPRVQVYYTRLCALPRRTRRALARQWRRSLSAIALLLALGQAPALAATIRVAPDILPDINADGICALIEAIDNANADAQTHSDCVAGEGADTIKLPTGSTQSLTAVDNSTLGPTGLPLITSTVTIRGRNSTIRRESNAPNFRILAVDSSGDLTLRSTTVSGGRNDLADFSGGGIANYGGTLTLTNSTISGNNVTGYPGQGGGVYNSGTLTLTKSTVSGNSVGFDSGGGVFNSGTATLIHSTVSGNSDSGTDSAAAAACQTAVR
jgi:hypothetical protein